MITQAEIEDASDEIRTVLDNLDCFTPSIEAPERGEFTINQASMLKGINAETMRKKLEEQVRMGILVRREVILHGRRQYLYRKVK